MRLSVYAHLYGCISERKGERVCVCMLRLYFPLTHFAVKLVCKRFYLNFSFNLCHRICLFTHLKYTNLGCKRMQRYRANTCDFYAHTPSSLTSSSTRYIRSFPTFGQQCNYCIFPITFWMGERMVVGCGHTRQKTHLHLTLLVFYSQICGLLNKTSWTCAVDRFFFLSSSVSSFFRLHTFSQLFVYSFGFRS